MGETLERIAFLYQLEEEEIKKENKHIRMWGQLVPGTKLKIPTISETVEQDIAMMEPFIEDYYPKLKLDPGIKSNPVEEEKLIKEETKESIKDETKPLEVIQSSSPQEIKTFVPENTQTAKLPPVNPEYRPPLYYYPQYLYYQYPRAVYPAYYYPVYYYPTNQ